jgi:hypothetical protein
MKMNIMQPCARDHVPMLSYIVTVYLITLGVLALIQ